MPLVTGHKSNWSHKSLISKISNVTALKLSPKFKIPFVSLICVVCLWSQKISNLKNDWSQKASPLISTIQQLKQSNKQKKKKKISNSIRCCGVFINKFMITLTLSIVWVTCLVWVECLWSQKLLV